MNGGIKKISGSLIIWFVKKTLVKKQGFKPTIAAATM